MLQKGEASKLNSEEINESNKGRIKSITRVGTNNTVIGQVGNILKHLTLATGSGLLHSNNTCKSIIPMTKVRSHDLLGTGIRTHT